MPASLKVREKDLDHFLIATPVEGKTQAFLRLLSPLYVVRHVQEVFQHAIEPVPLF